MRTEANQLPFSPRSVCQGAYAETSTAADIYLGGVVHRKKKLEELDLRGCAGLTSLPEIFSTLSQLKQLQLARCSSLLALPSSLSDLHGLQRISLGGCCALTRLPDLSYLSGLTVDVDEQPGEHGREALLAQQWVASGRVALPAATSVQ